MNAADAQPGAPAGTEGEPKAATAQGASAEDWLHFDLMLGLVGDLLPVIHDRRVKPSSTSNVPEFGKIPSEYTRSGEGRGIAGWQMRDIAPADVARWSADRRYSLSIRCSAIRAIDCDITDAALAAEVAALIAERVGSLPKRTRAKSPKFLHAFRLTGKLQKRVMTTVAGRIEFLANGQQFVAAGRHPSGVLYEWEGGRPLDIPKLTREEFEALWAAMQERFGAQPTKPPRKVTRGGVKGSWRTAIDDPDNLRLALAYRAPRCSDYDSWSDTGLKLRSLGDDMGLSMFEHFSALAPNPNPKETAREWWERNRNAPVDSDFTSIFKEEQALGWSNPGAGTDVRIAEAGDFPVDEADGGCTTAPAARRQKFQPIPVDQFANGPEPEWIIEGLIPAAELAVVYGEPGSGKSFFVADLAATIARGVPWRGKSTRAGRVVYVCAESAHGFRQRWKAYAQAQEVDLGTLGGSLFMIGEAPNLLNADDVTELCGQLLTLGRLDFIVIDTLARATPGANENSGEDMGKALGHCKTIHQVTGALVCLVHHSGKDQARGARGWSGIRAAADTEIEVTRGSQNILQAELTKQRDGQDGLKFEFTLQSVESGKDSKGRTLSSLVVRAVELPQRHAELKELTKPPTAPTQRIVWDVLMEEGEPLAVGDLLTRAAAKLTRDPADTSRDRRRELVRREVDRLRTKRVVTEESDGRIGLRFWKMEFQPEESDAASDLLGGSR